MTCNAMGWVRVGVTPLWAGVEWGVGRVSGWRHTTGGMSWGYDSGGMACSGMTGGKAWQHMACLPDHVRSTEGSIGHHEPR